MNELALSLPGTFTETALELQPDLPQEQWEAVGETLGRIGRAHQWWIGDWLNYGERAYGEKYAQGMEVTGLEYCTLMNIRWVAERIETSRRREVLSWAHHQEVAPREPEEQDFWLARADEEGLTRSDLRKAIREQGASLLPSPLGKFRILYADPPWFYGRDQHTRDDSSGGASTHYQTLTLDEICEYRFEEKPLGEIIEEDAALFIWATSPLLPDALRVIEAWGFTYKASFVWDKVKHNVGNYNSVRHELLLVATRGSCLPEVKTLIDSVQVVERSEHSSKPDRFYEIIETLYPSASKVELFARRTREGWTASGYEAADAA